MDALLYIPWFKGEPWEIPLPGGHTLPIQPFGILVAIGVLLGAKVAERFGKRNGIAPGVVGDLVGHVVIGGFVFGYFLNSAMYKPEQFLALFRDPGLLFREYLGLSSYGGFIGAVIGLIVWRWRRGLSMLVVGDAAVYALPFGWFFGRLGCFVAKDHPGAITDFFLAVDNYHFGEPIRWEGREPIYAPRHDLGLYEAMWTALVIPLFLWLGKKPRRRGFYLALLPTIYAPFRFPLDYLRADDARYGGLTPGQYASFLFLAVGLGLFWWIRTHPDPELPERARYKPEDEEKNEKRPEKDRAGKKKRARAK